MHFPMSEFLLFVSDGTSLSPYFGDLFLDEPLPKDGWVDLGPNKSGFGVTLDKKIFIVSIGTDQQQDKSLLFVLFL